MMTLDYWALTLALLGLVSFFLWKPRSKNRKGVPFPFINNLSLYSTWRTKWAYLPQLLLGITLGFFLLGWIDIHWEEPVYPYPPKEGIALYLVLDRSRSMAQPALGGGTKLDQLKKVASRFVQERPNDMIGLIAFARGADILAPLTLDHQDLLSQLEHLGFVEDFSEDGTAMGYALFKGANLLDFVQQESEVGAYQIKSRVVVMVTDGFQDVNPLDRDNRLRAMGLEEAAEEAAKRNVKMYLINVDPRMGFEDFSPQRHQMERAANKTGGALYLIETPDELKGVFAKINGLEKSPLPFVNSYNRKKSLSFLFMGCGLFSLFLSLLLGTTVLRRAP